VIVSVMYLSVKNCRCIKRQAITLDFLFGLMEFAQTVPRKNCPMYHLCLYHVTACIGPSGCDASAFFFVCVIGFFVLSTV